MVEEIDDYDYLKYGKDSTIKNFTRDELILFSDAVKKRNHYGMNQTRNLIVTPEAIYNLSGKTLKRRFALQCIRGITVSKQTEEFVIHCNDTEYDYQYMSPRKKKIVEIIAKYYFMKTQQDLKLFELEMKSLSTFVTTKKEKKKDVNFSRMPHTNPISVSAYIYGIKTETKLANKKAHVQQSEKIYAYKDLSINDFEIIKTIGRGSCGKILLCKYNNNGEYYAIKSMRKDQIISENLIDNIKLEKEILADGSCQFLLSLNFFLQSEERIYFVTPYMKGGDFFHHLYYPSYGILRIEGKEGKHFPSENAFKKAVEVGEFKKLDDEDIEKIMDFYKQKKERKLSERDVKFYLAQIAIALGHLHEYNNAYRDLKPENILIDEDGYIKLCDFGSAVHIQSGRTFGIAGSAEYNSPEMITGEGHNVTTDWWSFGILMYEMIYGFTPFYHLNKNRMKELIRWGELKFPSNDKVSNDAKDCMIKLLDKNPANRLGANGLKDIKNHPFFCTLNFEDIKNKKLKAPFKPKIADKDDTSNFDEEFLKMNISESPVGDWISNYKEEFEVLNDSFNEEDDDKDAD